MVVVETVHDLGGQFPNWAIYGAVADYLVAELHALSAETREALAPRGLGCCYKGCNDVSGRCVRTPLA